MSQKDDNGREHPIHYASRCLNNAEKNCSASEREALGVIFAPKNVIHYHSCQKFKFYTDDEALKYVLNMKDTYGKIARRMSLLSEFDCEISYRTGAKNANASYLSRRVGKRKLVLRMSLESYMKSVAK